MATWNLDKAHSEIEFKVKHMMVSNVKGQFKDFDVILASDSDDITQGKVNVDIKSGSIDTKSEQRDQHLKSEDFFNVSAYPAIKFTSTEIKKIDDESYEITGDLTIKEVSKPVTFKAEFGGIAKDPWGNQKTGYTVTGKINRQEFDLTWNTALETGGVMVSNDVKIQAEIQFVLA
ncbi:YceI family protein [Sphingobacterium sp. JB170]|uniref:YceI family protein n=1 Tax=Sphingobacterium sp. JB170 TaxID=1434842 RepID=UPI000B3590D1|nr:YceI family protein [Sphingobacterium sp. JB170]